jgi:hypothetical protein
MQPVTATQKVSKSLRIVHPPPPTFPVMITEPAVWSRLRVVAVRS